MGHQFVFTMQSVRKVYPPDKAVIKGMTLAFLPGAKIGVIGHNGSGKSTLLKIIAGVETEYQGETWKPDGLRIGYLPQEEMVLEELPLIDSVMQCQSEIKRIEKQILMIQHQLENDDNPEKLVLDKLGHLEHHYAALGGYEIEYQAKQILSGLGFKTSDFKRMISEFSGGWRMRSVLAGLLLKNPDVLLLDEPTNHLDLPSLEWLEQYLYRYKYRVQ